jgi:hypothetical protein
VSTYERTTQFIRTTPPKQPLFALWTPFAQHGPFVSEARYADASMQPEPWCPPSNNEA